MNIRSIYRFRSHAFLGISIIAVTIPLSGSVALQDPKLFTGSGSIDPTDAVNIKITAAGSTSKATLEALAGFGVVQDFVGFTQTNNVMVFSDPLRSDVRISFSGTGYWTSTSGPGTVLNNANFATSGSDAIRFLSNSNSPTASIAHTIIAAIEFGEWNSDTNTFDQTAGGTKAAAFTLATGAETRFELVESITASFLSTIGSVLSSQTVLGPSGKGTQGIYFGYLADGTDLIGSVVLTMNVKGKTGSELQALFGLDDIGFAASIIPEPSIVAFLFGVVSLLGVSLFRQGNLRKRNCS